MKKLQDGLEMSFLLFYIGRRNDVKQINRIVPIYAIIPLLSGLLYNCIVYWGSNILCSNLPHYDFTMAFDRKVPFIPEFISFYFLAYVFWIVNYILIGRGGKEKLYRFVTADLLSRTVCLIFFVLMPTTNIRPELHGDSIWIELVRGLYKADQPTNLFPSIHCLVSWFCVIGIKDREDIPKWYKYFSLIFAALICISTQTLKQHYIIDLIGGIALAEITFRLSNHYEWYRHVHCFFERMNDGAKSIIIQRRKICEEK